MSTVTRDFIGALLNRDPTERLGAGAAGLTDVMSDPFFSEVTWDDVRGKKAVHEWVPAIHNPEDNPGYQDQGVRHQGIWDCIYGGHPDACI
jgi:hypothetical protein